MNNLKKTLALMATLVMAATAFVGCGDEKTSSASESKTESSADESSAAEETTAGEGEETTDAPAASAKSEEVGAIDASVGTGDSTFTVAAWDANDVPYLIAQWKGLSFDTIAEDLKNDAVEGVKFINFGCGGGDAPEMIDQLLAGGDDLDVYFCEADWALKYIGSDNTLDLAKLGFTDANFADLYSYTDEIGKDSNGVRKGASWQAAAGGFMYRSDLAEQYLGVKSPAEMQAKIGNWSDFVAAAQTISEASGSSVALADTLGGMWQAYACGRTTPWVKDNKLQIDDFCEEFANNAKALWDCGGVTKNTQWSDAWTAAGVNGSCMGYFVSTWGFGGFALDASGYNKDTKTGETYGKWAVCQGPASYYWGGTWIVVNSATNNGEEAQQFIKTATVDSAAMKDYAQKKPEYVNNKVVMEELVGSNVVMNQAVTDNFGGQNYFAELHENAKSINFNGLITQYDATVKTDFINAVQETMLDGSGSWDDTKEAFKDKVANDIPDLDWDE